MQTVRSFVGMDVHKETISISVAEDGRDGLVRFISVKPARRIAKMAKRLAKHGELDFCYEAGGWLSSSSCTNNTSDSPRCGTTTDLDRFGMTGVGSYLAPSMAGQQTVYHRGRNFFLRPSFSASAARTEETTNTPASRACSAQGARNAFPLLSSSWPACFFP